MDDYHVTFIGKKRKENDGVSSVYRSFEQLKQYTESMKQQYESLTNEQVTIVTMNGQNRERSSNDLLIEVINHHQQSTGVRGRQFVCENRDETYCNDKSNEIEQRGKKEILITPKYPLRSQLPRQKVEKRETTYLNQFQNVIFHSSFNYL